MPLVEMDGLVASDFCDVNARWGSFSAGRAGTPSGREILRNTLYHYDLRDAQQRKVLLQVYEGIGGLGGEMWDQEVTVLQRLTALRHPALPQLAHGGSVPADETVSSGVEGYAFVVTEAAGEPLYARGTATFAESIEHFRNHRDQAVVQLMSLADGLTLLHGMGVAHRNIWPGTIEAVVVDGQPVLRLTRFEMSALVSNLLRFVSWDARRRADESRRLMLEQGARALAYFSPDRVRALFAPDTAVRDQPDDVYGLGMMAAEWFVGALPTKLVADTEAALRDCGADPEPVVAKVIRLNRHVHGALAACAVPLRSLLRSMIDLHPPSRPAAGDVVDQLSDHFEALVHATDGPPPRPYALLFMPEECKPTLQAWRKVRSDPTTPAGRVELADFIERDLRGARLYHAPLGAAPFMPDPADEDRAALERASYLLLGHEVAWFCQEYLRASPFGGAGRVLQNVLLIKYVVDCDSGRGRQVRDALAGQRRYRLVPPVEVWAWDVDPALIDELAEDARPWSDLIAAVRSIWRPSEAEARFTAAFDFLLEFQQEELAAHRYPYTVVPDGSGDYVTLQFDRKRDRMWRFSSAMARTIADSPRLRPPMGDYFAPGQRDGDAIAVLRPDEEGKPARRRGVEVEVVHAQHDVVEIRGGRRHAIPSPGWIELAEDVGSRVALGRQWSARWELLRNRLLVEQLDSPYELRRESLTKDAGKAAVAERLRTAQPLFALQGPPGTGKTETTATAICEYLRDQPFARVLVSAQSNYALDNIAERVLDKLGLRASAAGTGPMGDVVALRVTTPDRARTVDEAIRPFVLSELADRTYRNLLSDLTRRRAKEPDPAVRDLLEVWVGAVSDGLAELTDRMHRSANLVFATCSAATRRNLNRGVPADTFDWVVIEEAAKAWPTELAIPLVRGGRWTLVGDHRQLPAHRRREIEEFLVAAGQSTEEDVQQHGRRHADHVSVFDLFGRIFDDARLPPLQRGFGRPRFTLRTQYRMRKAICEVVSRAFYPDPTADDDGAPLRPGLLNTGRDDDCVLTRPATLASSALVWVDTTDVPDCADAPTWTNAGEVRVVEEILRRLRPRPMPGADGYGQHPVAVLSPYRRQVDLLRGRAEIRDYVYTIHAFQGREADVVVASLVRDRLRGTPEQPWRSIGHLTQPELVNVLLSRARSHLLLVGSLRHFEQCGDPTWRNVCALVRHFGCVVPAGEWDD